MKKRNLWVVAGGVILMLVGVVWFFQGLGALKGSPMTGEIFWSYMGAIVFIAGIAVLLRALLGTKGTNSR
ncbi:hypothetical protein LBMAG15_16500 [Actinomycetes bacterium]|nr:hypothetical protein LBMAG15_16500 [Actinomycetes bacterium]